MTRIRISHSWRTIPPTLGISPKLCAGAVTSITERRTEPLVRAAESGEPARGLWAPRCLFEGIVVLSPARRVRYAVRETAD